LLHGALQTMMKYNIKLDDIPFDNSDLSELIVGNFHDFFVKKWGGKNVLLQMNLRLES
jgi:hypothetical protein